MQPRVSANTLRLLLVSAIGIAWTLGTNARSASDAQPRPKEPTAASVLTENTVIAAYGRAFGRAPILGRLGAYKDFEDAEKDLAPWIEGISRRHDKKGVIPALHLIYAMANPCKPNDDCLLYIEGPVKDLIGRYIEPAAKRGWMVILDTQIGRSSPARQVRRIIDKGYLRYENVALAVDPEFHVQEGRLKPGIPIGTVEASEINEIQQMLDEYVRAQKLKNKKVLIVHQFGDPNVDDGVPFMIQNKKNLKTYKNVELVFDMDGLGKQAIKVVKYNKITDVNVYPFIKFRGIKIFFQNRWEKHGHFDKPPLNLDQIFGLEKVKGGAKIATKPDVIIIA
jgi:hypothetical protein